MILPFRKSIAPSREEKLRNPRARSARLRCGIVRAA
jgi:16S rRNA C1402 N4-methylase RsmH